jgi:long-chain acyl-CoA synthetase
MARSEALRRLIAPGKPYELVQNQLGQREFAHGPRTLRELFEQTASDAPFLVYEEETLTFRQVS